MSSTVIPSALLDRRQPLETSASPEAGAASARPAP